jgi:hypothetical protein
MLKQISNIIAGCLVVVVIGNITPVFAALSCSITTAAGCTNTVVLRLSSASDAHAEMPSQSTATYSNNVVCCSGLSGVSCAGNSASILNLSSTTNAHVEIATNSNYPNVACMTGASEIPVIAYQDNNCTGYDTTLVSISSTTNATVGSSTEYVKRVCGSLTPASITFTLATTTLYFGGLSSVITRYASSTNVDGDSVQVEAHNFTVRTNALNGYSVNVQGGTLASGANIIAAIGGVNSSPVVNTNQFGIRVVPSGGIGTVTSPYAASGFAYSATATTSAQVASATSGDNATTTYSVRYVANIAATTKAGAYVANLVYVATANF